MHFTPMHHWVMLSVGIWAVAGFSLKKTVGKFRIEVINPFQRVIKQLNQAQQAAMFAEVSGKLAVRGTYDKRRGITAANISEMVLNVAYTLRHFKFNDFDRRYEKQWREAGRVPSRNLFLRFPRPSLTSLHSAVADQCWPSLYRCLWYLDTITRQMYTTRRFDPLAELQKHFKQRATVANVARWRAENSEKFNILLAGYTWRCAMLHRVAVDAPEPFHSTVERFRWLTTATYFMCWYTQHQMPELAFFGERCDNFADCMQSDDSTSVGNQDARVRSPDTPFACALYSFCPEVCCPLRSVRSLDQCADSPLNPCMPDNRPGERQCSLDSANNRHFDALIANYVNVSCRCPHGHRFSAYFRRCVDVDECFEGADNCNRVTETCVNMRGDFDCVCRYGFSFNVSERACRPSSEVRLEEAVAVAQMRRNSHNRSLSQRLRQIEEDLRSNRVRAYFSWLPWDRLRVSKLGEVVAGFGKLRRLLKGAAGRSAETLSLLVLCVGVALTH